MIELKFKELSREETFKQFDDTDGKNLQLDYIERHPDGTITLGFIILGGKQ